MDTQLPVKKFRRKILSAVKQNQVVIITADTGAGKSTQVPQYLLEEGYRVVVTQPRRVAARMVATRIAEERNEPLGQLVGYKTANESESSSESQLLLCTDGLQLVRELFATTPAGQVLVIDEVHEWNLSIETLVAWAKMRTSEDPDFKVVLMSATMDVEALSQYFGGCPIISVPGQTYPVSFEQGEDVVSAISQLVMTGQSTLVFLPGKAEISQTMRALEKSGVDHKAVILPLHGDLNSVEQGRIFDAYSKPKVVLATNIAQTSVTIDDVDAVVDSGLEKQLEVRDGIEGLYLTEISQADCMQRAGRAGRVGPGVYVLCSSKGLAVRPTFPQAEIERVRLDQLVLRLATAGLDAEALEFFHQPAVEVIRDAKQLLFNLGAFAEDGTVTEVGYSMMRFPIDVRFARMIVEAEYLQAASAVVTIVSCMEAGGIRLPGSERGNTRPWSVLSSEEHSDLIAELECYDAATLLAENQLSDMGVSIPALQKARQIRARLARIALEDDGNATREDILEACFAGFSVSYEHVRGRNYKSPDGQVRKLDRTSVIRRAGWVTGLPFDMGTRVAHGKEVVHHLITFATSLDTVPARKEEVLQRADTSFDELEAILGLRFTNRALLRQVFTHRSYLNEHRDEELSSYERLEFFGDKVIGFLVGEYLYTNVPKPEGELTLIVNALVSNKAFSEIGAGLGFDRYIRMSRGEQKGNERARVYMYACVIEALVGAIYLEFGIDEARRFVETHIMSRMEEAFSIGMKDAKSQLQELVQSLQKPHPEYHVLDTRGPEHDRVHQVVVFVDGEMWGNGEGPTIAEASRLAAVKALENQGPVELQLAGTFANVLRSIGVQGPEAKDRVENIRLRPRK